MAVDHVKKRKGNWKRRIILVSTIVFGILLILGIALWVFYHSSPFEEPNIGPQKKFEPSLITPETLKEKTMNLLFCGIDYDEESKDRSAKLTDVMLLVNYDIANQQAHVLQIPRDTYVDDKYHTGGFYKINGIYNQSKGGLNGLVSAINGNFQLPVDHYVTVTMDGFRTIVDKLGGIEIDSPFAFSRGGYQFVKGKQTLTGKQAEVFVRERYRVTGGDAGRQKSQRAFMTGLMNRLLQTDIQDMVALLPVLTEYIKTDLSIKELSSLAATAKGLKKSNITFHTPPGTYIEHQFPNRKKPLWIYSMNKQAVADVLNDYFRPYSDPVPASELDILQLSDKITQKDEEQTMDETGAKTQNNSKQ